MRIYNKSKREFLTAEGLLSAGGMIEIAKSEALRLSKLYPSELELIDDKKVGEQKKK